MNSIIRRAMVLVLLLSICSTSSHSTAFAADTSPSVTVANTGKNPVPVNGNVNVTNTAQNPVPVTGSVTVNQPVQSVINNSAKNPVPVTITNPAITTTDSNRAAHTPYAKAVAMTMTTDIGNSTFTVPNGKLLVVQTISAGAAVHPGVNILLFVTTVCRGAMTVTHLPMLSQGSGFTGTDGFAMCQALTIFADPGSTVTVSLHTTNALWPWYLDVSLSGYLVDASAASFD
jgi:hypothetical protein